MEANPDLPGAEVDRWLSHLKHHLRRYAKEKESKVEVRPLVAVTCASIVDGLVIGPALADSDLKCPDGEAEANNLHVATIDEVTTNPEREDILHSTSSSNWDIPQCQTSSIYCPLVDSFRNDGARHSTITALPPDTSLTRKTISLVGFKEISSSPRALSSNAALMDLSWNFRMVTRTAALPPLPPVPPPSFRLLNNALWHAPLLTSIGQEWILTPVVGSRLSTFGLSGNLGSVISDLMIW
ncbi:uncharacterized protein LOC133511370 isoform X2 [Syngnathoides biaculeatus]|uniref:uncharacterized protein LOC133511370 isoform X2 n=1 Tax=Syngnathoides biaculeatus TaxID=300417 RepID=UPI002ADE5B1A|nr:uncharacterized protein LOC133511370 isoform X2 [Syngnathoides biaculeatus]